jgi:hypothetical protein
VPLERMPAYTPAARKPLANVTPAVGTSVHSPAGRSSVARGSGIHVCSPPAAGTGTDAAARGAHGRMPLLPPRRSGFRVRRIGIPEARWVEAVERRRTGACRDESQRRAWVRLRKGGGGSVSWERDDSIGRMARAREVRGRTRA